MYRPLLEPLLVAVTPTVARLVSISDHMTQSDFFLQLFSGNSSVLSEFTSSQIWGNETETEVTKTDDGHAATHDVETVTSPCSFTDAAATVNTSTGSGPNLTFPTWATPYALSIYGHERYDNCPFGEYQSHFISHLHCCD